MNTDSAILKEWQAFFAENVKSQSSLVDGYLSYVEHSVSQDIPAIFELGHFSDIVGVEENTLHKMVNNTASFYREFKIKKRRGGHRTINVPSPTLLYIQRWILSEILSKLEIHDSSHGFVLGRSVVTNASVHRNSNCFLKMDIENYFPSIRFNRVMKIFLRLGYPLGVSYFLTSFCCLNKRLPQGAATSPSLSNLVANGMDKSLHVYAQKYQLHYSRYADDLVFSGHSLNKQNISQVTYLVEQHRFKINTTKTQLIPSGRKAIITGVSISNGSLHLPRKSVRDIKSCAYRLIKFGFVEYSKNENHFDPLVYERLLGRISFWLQIDPENSTANRLQDTLLQEMQGYENKLSKSIANLPSFEDVSFPRQD